MQCNAMQFQELESLFDDLEQFEKQSVERNQTRFQC